MLGRNSCYADQCKEEGFIGADFDIHEDLTGHLYDDLREFNKEYIPKYQAIRPEKSNAVAGLSCGFLYTICKGLNIGDIVLSPDGKGSYYVGTIASDYYYVANEILPHRRKVTWSETTIKRSDMSVELRNSIGSIGTCSDATRFASEIESLLAEPNITIKISPVVQQQKVKPTKQNYLERDLHRLFCNYLRSNNIIGKTIFHEHSNNEKNQKWVHPDIVGVNFESFSEDVTQTLQKAMEPQKAVRIYSYELKRCITNDYELKQFFFQALSNSSWANYGYLVAYDIDEGLNEEISRLNSAFGIGVILMKAKPEDTNVLFPAKEKELDYNTIDKLCHLNPDFKNFISGMTRVMNASRDYLESSLNSFENSCDKIFNTPEEIENYCSEKNIPF